MIPRGLHVEVLAENSLMVANRIAYQIVKSVDGHFHREYVYVVLLMFARGSKSDKLAELFNIFDVNKTGYLSSGSFQRFVKSVLMCIVQWTEEYWDEAMSFPDPATMCSTVLDAAAALTDQIFADAETVMQGTAITFESFANW